MFQFNEPTEDVLIPVFFPESLLKMDLPLGVMKTAIFNFNKKIEEGEELLIREHGVIQAKISCLLQTKSNLFMQLIVPKENVRRAETLKARLMGYVMMNKETTLVQELVIEGFTFVRAQNSMGKKSS